ncbi:MAG: dephospho-CoA kinase [Lachnospiraceae bacterium]|nr:dephospho-CoA kinase [Lachnospiraceae bacterium]
MKKIGVTGGVGAGKSRVLDYLSERWGAFVLRLDDVGRDLLLPEGACYREVIRLFGEAVVREDQSLDRPLIARKIFGNEELRQRMNAIIHPAVRREAERQMEKAGAEAARLFVLEAALLLEDHYEEILDEIWYVRADEAVRAARLAESRGYDESRIRNVMASQLSDEAFRKRADAVIDNSGDFEETKRQIDRLVRRCLGEGYKSAMKGNRE